MVLKTTLKFAAVCLVFYLSLVSDAVLAGVKSSDLSFQVSHSRLFQDPILWIGQQSPPESESQNLLVAIADFKSEGRDEGLLALDKFASENPDSGWTPSILIHLAEYECSHGQYSEALKNWKLAWTKINGRNDSASQKLVLRNIAGWTRLLASLGRKQQLEEIFTWLKQSNLPLGVYATSIDETKEALGTMERQPGLSYRCGTFALAHLAMAQNEKQTIIKALFDEQSPDGGFTMEEILKIARTNGIDVEAVRKPMNAALIVPCIVHWKINHYAAIVDSKNGKYLVEDPTFEGHVWMDEKTIEDESSGDYILPKKNVPSSWKIIGLSSSRNIFGKGVGNMVNDSADTHCHNGDDGNGLNSNGNGKNGQGSFGQGSLGPVSASGKGGGSSGSSPACLNCGMPGWSVSEPYETVWLQDTPIFYNESDLTTESAFINYKQRGSAQDGNIAGLGNDWTISWLQYLTINSASETYTNVSGMGGQLPYAMNSANYASVGVLSDGTVNGNDPPTITYPSGLEEYFGYAVGFSDGTTNYFLTLRVDQYGRILESFNYQMDGEIVKLESVVDKDGRTNILSYENTNFPNLITKIGDPYGRFAVFNYDANGELTNIADAENISSSFSYDENGYCTNLSTPYGVTGFSYFDGQDTNGYLARSVLVTEPTGDHQLFAYRDDSPEFVPTYDGYGSYRLSYHWDRKQYLALSETNFLVMGTNDFQKASVKHWLHGDPSSGTLSVSSSMDSRSHAYDPVNGQRIGFVGYNYQGEQSPFISEGNTNALAVVTGIYGSGPYQRVGITVNSLGLPLVYTSFNSDGSQAVYSNFYDPSGRILEYTTGPRGELIVGCGHAPGNPALITSMTNAENDVWTISYETGSLKVASILFPSGMLRTNIYYVGGSESGFLAEQIDVDFRTNYFNWEDGNEVACTNELGLVTTYSYDSLNRLTGVGFPDNTTISNVYDKLDIVGVKNRLNQWKYYGYNFLDQLYSITNENGEITYFDYCDCGSPDKIIQSDGATNIVTSLDYNFDGLVTNVTFSDGYQLSYDYNLDEEISFVSDSALNALQCNYLNYGLNPVLQSCYLQQNTPNPGYPMFIGAYDEYGRLTNSLDRNNINIIYSYDQLNRITARMLFDLNQNDPGYGTLSDQESFRYNYSGLIDYTNPLGFSTKLSWDQSARLSSITNADMQACFFNYNAANELISIKDPRNNQTSWTYDAYGRVTSKKDNIGEIVYKTQYDDNDRITNLWSASSGSTTLKYDHVGNLTNILSQNSGSISYIYDQLNRLTGMFDSIGQTSFRWNGGGMLSGESGPWQLDDVNYSYNQAHQRSSMSISQANANPWVQSYIYDDAMRLKNTSSPAGSFQYSFNSGAGAGNFVENIFYGSESGQNSEFASYYHDGFGNTTTASITINPYLLYPAINRQYSYDSSMQVTQQVFTVGNYISYTYDPIGQLESANGFEPTFYNQGLNQYTNYPRLNEQFGYGYDNGWNLEYRTNNELVQTYSVNSLNQLSSQSMSGLLTVCGNSSEYYESIQPNTPQVTNVVVSGSNFQATNAVVYQDGSWALQGVNLLNGTNLFFASAQDNLGRSATNSACINLSISGNYSYDLNGKLTSDGVRQFNYDDYNELISISSEGVYSNNFVYDGLGRKRIEKNYSWNGNAWIETNEVHFVYDGFLVVQERDAKNTPLVTYTRGLDLSSTRQGAGGIGGLLARTDMGQWIGGSSMASAYYFSDAQGNVAGMVYPNNTLAAQYNYDPFGNLLAIKGPLSGVNHYRFSSKEWDSNSGMYYFGYRFYDPNLQRWLNQDPIGELGGLNLYDYVGNNPVNWIDSLGLRVYVFYHPAFFAQDPANHSAIVLNPDNPSDFSNNPLFGKSGGQLATLGGQPSGFGSSFFNPLSNTFMDPFGNLVSKPNYPGDQPNLKSCSSLNNLVPVQPPPGMSDSQFINSLINAANSYDNSLPYSPLPSSSPPGYFNSNGYTSGVISKTGAMPPALPAWVPGYERPIP